MTAIRPLLLLLLTVCRPTPSGIVTSWYGGKFQGRRTASGEIFDKNKKTAASRSYGFGTILKLSYRGKSCLVRVNDRGPFVRGRDLDVSEAVATELGFRTAGVALLTVEEVRQADQGCIRACT